MAVIEFTSFEKLCEKYTGKELFNLLDRIYAAFDEMRIEFGVESIMSTGHTYVCCAGIKICEKYVDPFLLR